MFTVLIRLQAAGIPATVHQPLEDLVAVTYHAWNYCSFRHGVTFVALDAVCRTLVCWALVRQGPLLFELQITRNSVRSNHLTGFASLGTGQLE